MSITIDISNLRDASEIATLYHRYDREANPQPAYVEIDEEGEVSADWNGEIGNAIPFMVFHRQTLRIGVSPRVRGTALADYLESEEAQALLERIHAGHEVEWDGSNHVGRLSEDAESAIEELDAQLEELEQVKVHAAEAWIERDSLATLWPIGQTLDQAVDGVELAAMSEGVVLDGDVRSAMLARLWRDSSWPSKFASEGRWDEAKRLIEYWQESAEAAGHVACDLDLDDSGMADAVEAVIGPMSNLDGFDHGSRREVVAAGGQEAEAEATLAEGLRHLAEKGTDLSWLPSGVREELVARRVAALDAWFIDNPE